MKPTRAEEGCISYELFRSTAKPTTFITVESSQAQSDLDAHMKTPTSAQALQAAAAAIDGPPAIHPLAPVSN